MSRINASYREVAWLRSVPVGLLGWSTVLSAWQYVTLCQNLSLCYILWIIGELANVDLNLKVTSSAAGGRFGAVVIEKYKVKKLQNTSCPQIWCLSKPGMFSSEWGTGTIYPSLG